MPRKKAPIPVHKFGSDTGFMIERITFDALPPLLEWDQPERHDRHAFFLIESGSVTIEIDFQRVELRAPAMIYMHPDQVHQIISFSTLSIFAWAIENKDLEPAYLSQLNEINPAAPAVPGSLIFEAAALCLKFTGDEAALRHMGHALIGLVLSLFRAKPIRQTRLEVLTRSFRKTLEAHYLLKKSPKQYADLLQVSLPYLNECVKGATGFPLSRHIRQRVVLEAKRLLYHSDRSVKEIAYVLGYDDYPYFSRIFTKEAGLSPIAFRKNPGSSKSIYR